MNTERGGEIGRCRASVLPAICIRTWNEFMRKRGLNDEATETLNRRKGKRLSDRDDIRTMFEPILTGTREGLCEKRDAAGVRTVPLSKIPG